MNPAINVHRGAATPNQDRTRPVGLDVGAPGVQWFVERVARASLGVTAGIVDEHVEPAERVEQVELEGRRQQRLVVVRTVHVDQQVAELLQGLYCGGRVVDQALRRRGARPLAIRSAVSEFMIGPGDRVMSARLPRGPGSGMMAIGSTGSRTGVSKAP